ncbi:MFS transporter [Phytomonospora endophytica]|uniref:MFS family permease n=1 Tax=Phytomonospora endophytica TaxID=714109 RepID=A0A841FCN6_9ACTN|nr:MFS transporter [Phytomonospora endophytica]MBB6033554.1 MFS family permease [Phytomonospora endophytica]GIG64929.1 MFS transporter [Phytomonospora endophytica]
MVALAPPRTSSALWTRNFSLYFTARSVALLGDGMLPVAVALAVGGAGFGPTGVGLVLAAFMVPFALLILFGGVFADRFTARRMMIGADLVRVATQSVVAVALFAGEPSLWLLVAMSAIAGAAAAMFQPGVNGMVRRVAADPQRANGTLRVADAIAQLAGPALSAILVAAINAGVVYAVNAATFAVSAVCLLALRLGAEPVVEKGTSMLRKLREGWFEFSSRTWMWGVIAIFSSMAMLTFAPLYPLGSALVTERLGPTAYGWVMSAMGAGTILGGLIAIRLKPVRMLRAGAVALIGFALMPLGYAVHAPFAGLIALHVLGGASWAFWSVMWSTSVQTQVAPEVLNRVTAYEVAGSVGSIPIGQALAGPMAALVGAEVVMGFGSAVGLACCLALLAVPAIRGLRRAGLAEHAKA